MGFLRRLFAGSSGKKQATVGAAVLTGVLGLTITGTTVVGGESALEGPPSPYPGTTSISFPTCGPTTTTLTGTRNAEFRDDTVNGDTFDFTGATWEGSPANYLYPIRSEGWTTGCIKGGTINGTIPEVVRTSWKDVAGVGFGESHAIDYDSNVGSWAYIDGGYATHVEDVVDPDAENDTQSTYVNHMKMERIPDDCFENEGASGNATEQPGNLYINNTYCEGFTVFASRPCSSCTSLVGTEGVVHHVENSLLYGGKYLLPESSTYCTAARVTSGRCLNGPEPGTYWGTFGIWKWSTEAPATVIVRNTIFRLDLPSYSSCPANGWPDGTYENVTLVYTGPGTWATAGGCTNTLPAGVTLTTDVSVWDDAVAAWNSQ